jgi:ATP-dependent helicase/nuclease subunit B
VNERSKQIWLGPVLGENRSRLIEKCAERVAANQSDSFLYLAASHPLLEILSQGILDGSKSRGLWGELPVYLFRGFVQRLLSTAAEVETGALLLPRTHIDSEELPLKHSLISQILRRLHGEKKLKALGPLATREGCINTVTTLIGEIQRAGKTPAELLEIIAQRTADYREKSADTDGYLIERNDPTFIDVTLLQRDFNEEVGLIYATYSSLLVKHQLTEEDEDGLRALAVLRGEIDGIPVRVPLLEKASLLIVDGFFDFTPIQGELLRLLVPRFSEVIVNLNKDERNQEIFKPFEETIKQLCGIADFEINYRDAAPGRSSLSNLRERLFNPIVSSVQPTDRNKGETKSEIYYFDCTDRETEIRAIAKEIKRLLLLENYKLSEVALVVRERAAYAETIARVMAEESLPCNIERRIIAGEIPAARAVLKVLAVLDDLAREESAVLKMPQLADQIKSGYFRLSREEIDLLASQFANSYSHLLSEHETDDAERETWRRRELSIGRWDPDMLENVIAYVGSELRIVDWLARCRKLITELPAAEATGELLDIDFGESSRDDEEAQIEDAETAQPKETSPEKKRRPQRDVHPATIAWAALVIRHFAARIQAVPREGQPKELRSALLKLLNGLQFRTQVMRPMRQTEDRELTRATADLHALEALRRAFLAAIKSIEITGQSQNKTIPVTTLIAEVRRCLVSQTVTLGRAEQKGLRVLEATDIRGLSYRALFIAGLIEGGFPLAPSRDWIYPHEERARLKRYGLTLEDISPATLLKEEHYFYQVACRATERLYLTRPLLLEGETETVASYYIDELRRAVAPEKMQQRGVVRPDYEGTQLDDASSAQGLTISLVRQEQHHLSGFQKLALRPSRQITRFLSLARNDGLVSDSALSRIAIERERAGQGFGPYDGRIDNVDLLSLISKRFGPDFVHSASGLSTFGNCPYRFFAQRVLKLQPRGEAALDLQALDAGKLLHDILRRFFESHRGQRLEPLQSDQLTAELLKIADVVFDQHQRVVPPLNRQIWKLDCEIRKTILTQVLLFELETQDNANTKKIVPSHFELAFGMKSTAMDPSSTDKPLRLTRSKFGSEETISVSGQIDRVDIAEPNQTVVAYDYRLSKGARKEDILAGRNLQIPIYLDALEQLFFPNGQIAGGGYYTLRGGPERRNTGIYRKDFNSYLNLQARIISLFSEDDWHNLRAQVRSLIWNFLDRLRTGNFSVKPSEGEKTCKFCDYFAVCRYDKGRVGRKNTEAP